MVSKDDGWEEPEEAELFLRDHLQSIKHHFSLCWTIDLTEVLI